MLRTELVVIDPQQDFCNPDGALFVAGADKDMERLSKFVDRTKDKLTDIHCTLDSHRIIDVAHPLMWRNSSTGEHPQPFTLISKDDVESGVWEAYKPSLKNKLLHYVTQLKANGRYPLCIWPPHCLIGHWGHNVVPELLASFQEWEKKKFAVVDFVTKGSNLFTEHYSALQADVPDPSDPSTQLNTELVQTLEKADLIVIAGEAGSHCLANTVRDIAAAASGDLIKKMILLEDATSPVTGFESFQDDFINDMVKLGMQISTTDKCLA